MPKLSPESESTRVAEPDPNAATGRLRRIPWALVALTGGALVVYAVFAWQQHRHVRTTSFDLGIFDQAVRAYSRFDAPLVPLKGEDYHLLGDHWHPILMLLAPLYWVWPHPTALLFAQAVLLASSIPVVWRFTERVFDRRVAYLVASAYSLSFGIQGALAFDFHEVAFAVPLVALAIERAQAGRLRAAGLSALALLLVKEDMGFLVAAFGVALLIRGHRRWGAALVVGGLAAFEVTTKLLIPHFGDGQPYAYWYYGALGPDLPGAVRYMVTNPLATIRLFFTPFVKTQTLLWLFAPTGFVALVSPWVLMTIPLLAERMFSDHPSHWTTRDHYNLVLMPIVALAAVDGAAMVVRRLRLDRRLVVAWASAGLAVAVLSIPLFSFRLLFTREEWSTTPVMRSVAAGVRVVPHGAHVEASDRVGPQLLDTATVYLMDGKPHPTDWAIAELSTRDWPWESVEALRAHLDRLRSEGFQTVYDDGTVVVLRREK